LRIQRINNATAFGYDKKLNKELKAKLKSDTQTDPAVIETITKLNTFCNATENKLNNIENNNKTNAQTTSILYGTFSPTKIILSALVDSVYPDLKYPTREYNSYIEEAGEILEKTGEVFTWQYSMAAELGFNLPPEETLDPEDLEAQGEIDYEEVPELTPEQQAKWDEAEKDAPPRHNSNDDEIKISDVIQKFEPTFSSPKGFESIGGMNNLKEELYDKIIYPALHPEEAKLDFEEYGKRYPRGIMLYGPPGCGKTFILEALSQEADFPLFKLKIGKAGSKFINETSRNYEKAFEHVANHSKETGKPCILFIDEVDGMTKGRDSEASGEDLKQMSTLLNLIETARDRNIIVVAATNKYDIVDEAIRRRFDSQVYVGMPDTETREQIFKKTLSQWTKGQELASNEEAMHQLGRITSGFPSSALVILADKASTMARKDGRRPISMQDFITVIDGNQNLKINEQNYKTKSTKRPTIGFIQRSNNKPE